MNFILPQSGREISWKFEQDGAVLQLPIASYLQFDYAEALLTAAIGGAGIIQAPKYILATAIDQGKLQPILTNYASKEEMIVAIVYPQKKYLSAKIRNLKRDGIVD